MENSTEEGNMYQSLLFLYIGFLALCALILLVMYECKMLVRESEERLTYNCKKALFELGSKVEHEHQFEEMARIKTATGTDSYEQCKICGKTKIEKSPFDSLAGLEPETAGKFPPFQKLRKGFKSDDDDLPWDEIRKL